MLQLDLFGVIEACDLPPLDLLSRHTLERSHAELADQTERLNCLIASAIPGVLITDEQGTVTNVSQSFGTMFGLDGP